MPEATARRGGLAAALLAVEAGGAGQPALAQALEVQRTAAAEAVQWHGEDHAAHLYFRRAAGDELLLGPASRLRAGSTLTEVHG